jgi:hypothetical protein
MATKHSNIFSSLVDSDSDSDGENTSVSYSVSTPPHRGCPSNINSHIQRIYGLLDIGTDLYPCSACDPAMAMEDCGWDCPHVSLGYTRLFPSWQAACASYHSGHSAADCGGQCPQHPLMTDDVYLWFNAAHFNTTWGDLCLEQEQVYWNSLSSKQRAIILAERAAEERTRAEKAARDSIAYERILRERQEAIDAYNAPEAIAARAAEKARRKAEREAREIKTTSSSNFSRWDTEATSSSSSMPETRRSSVSSSGPLHHDETPSGGWGGCETNTSTASAPRKMVRCKPTERHRGDGGLMPCKFHCWDNVWGRLCTRPGKDGKVFSPGCSHSDCPYVHPDQPEWNDELKALFEQRIANLASRPPRHNGPSSRGGRR